jgi:hypothetical protein
MKKAITEKLELGTTINSAHVRKEQLRATWNDLGRMGANTVRKLLNGNHCCVVFDSAIKAVEGLVRDGVWPGKLNRLF